jgi:hypothetical protein
VGNYPLAKTVGVGQTARSTTYHYINDSQSRSLCGALDNTGHRGREIILTLTEKDAIQHGLHLCARCADCENHNPSTEDSKHPSQ